MIMQNRILITGASGFLGSHLITKLLDKGDTSIIAVLGRPEDNTNYFPKRDNIEIYPCSELFTTDFGHVDTLIHTAFSRGDNLLGLTASIEMTRRVIELTNNQDIDSILNISSQGLYQTLSPGEKATEEGAVGPDTAYGLAKWAVENMLIIGCKKHYTNIRMASLSANARFLDFFVKSVIGHQEITVTAPHQYASIMDISDAINGILSINDISLAERHHTYNLGPGTQYSILDYAESANYIGREFGFPLVNILINDTGKESAVCMDCSRLMKQTAWRPNISKEEMIFNLFKKYKELKFCK